MSTVVLDTFTDTNWKELRNDANVHTGEVGATWVRHPAVNPGSSRWYIFNNRVHCGVWGTVYASGVPASADYSVFCDYLILSKLTGRNLGICGRMSTSADTYYGLYYDNGELILIKRVAGVTTTLGFWIGTLATGTPHAFELRMAADSIKAFVNDVERISATDSAITDTGRAGVRAINSNDAHTGHHIDNFRVVDTSTPPSGQSQVIGLVGL